MIADAITDARAVLVLEPSADGALKTSRKGTSWYTVGFAGRAAHAGLDPERGVNALSAAAELVTPCSGWGDPALGTTVTPDNRAHLGDLEATLRPDKPDINPPRWHWTRLQGTAN